MDKCLSGFDRGRNVQQEVKNVQFGVHLNDIPDFCQAGKTAGKNPAGQDHRYFLPRISVKFCDHCQRNDAAIPRLPRGCAHFSWLYTWLRRHGKSFYLYLHFFCVLPDRWKP